MADRFLGSWLVTEHVHTPEGSYLGDIRQRRTLEQVAPDRIRVTQDCTPAPELEGHAMAAFAGTWVFDLEVSGSRRRYLGPDVVGHGTEWVAGATTGRGLWPRFGCGFTSWSILFAPNRQLTGGWFEIAGRPVAAIVGVAVPDPDDGTDIDAPTLDLGIQPALPVLDESFSSVHHRVGPLLVVDSWAGPDHHERRLVIADAALGAAATLVVTEIGGTRLGDLEVVPLG
jgi:hypothetical protein